MLLASTETSLARSGVQRVDKGEHLGSLLTRCGLAAIGPRSLGVNLAGGNIPTIRYSSNVVRVRGDGCGGPLQTVDDDPRPGRRGGDG
jgi:hypothetical protein